MSKFIVLESTFAALVAGGILDEDPSCVRRVVIDLKAGSAGVVYVEKFADDELLNVIAQGGIEIVGAEER